MRILITGAARGIGHALVRHALAQGHTVIAADLDDAALASLVAGAPGRVRAVPLDVRQASAWEALASTLDTENALPDVLINVAGVLRSGQTGELKPDDIDLMLDVNVKGVIHGTNAFARHMKTRRAGHIINVGSVASLYATPGTTLYATSKFAVRGFSIAAAGDLRPHGVAVTLFGPGPVKTDMLEQQRGDPDAALTFSGARALSVDEVAAAILGPVLRKRPVEYFLPFKEELLGKLCNSFPGLFLSQIERARARGKQHFTAKEYQ